MAIVDKVGISSKQFSFCLVPKSLSTGFARSVPPFINNYIVASADDWTRA